MDVVTEVWTWSRKFRISCWRILNYLEPLYINTRLGVISAYREHLIRVTDMPRVISMGRAKKDREPKF